MSDWVKQGSPADVGQNANFPLYYQHAAVMPAGKGNIMQTVTLQLPEDIYRQFQLMASLTRQQLEEVMLQTIHGNLPPAFSELPTALQQELAIWVTLDNETLGRLVQETLPASQLRLQQKLLQKNEDGVLTDKERAELARLRAITDHFVLRRSTLLALLKWRGYSLPISTTPIPVYARAS